MIFLFPMNFFISFGRYNSKAIRVCYISVFTFKDIQWVPIDSYYSFTRFITYVPSFILGKVFRELKPLNSGYFDHAFVFQN